MIIFVLWSIKVIRKYEAGPCLKRYRKKNTPVLWYKRFNPTAFAETGEKNVMQRSAPTILENFYRHDIVTLLNGNSNIGVELGVAEGIFSERMVNSGMFATFIGIDMYADAHDTAQYKRALKRVGIYSNYKILRMRFDQALELFDDESLDFIYIDGYAHGGEEGGQTIFDWYKKVKVGGVIAGDDYHPDWPLVREAVNEFASQLGEELFITGKTETGIEYCYYPTWAVRKSRHVDLNLPIELVKKGLRVSWFARGGIKGIIRRLLPASVITLLRPIYRKFYFLQR
ncbi:MAG: class I SAM-dependent methyltransferase [Chlorobium sp.]|nr:class I SAM-dependent methyltransferase [Chlorobium sp.]